MNHNQCENAREFTGTTIADEHINSEFFQLRPEEKENAAKELYVIFNNLPMINFFTTAPAESTMLVTLPRMSYL